MSKLRQFAKNFKYEISLFSALCVNFALLLLQDKDEVMGDVLYPLHLVDIKAGLVSRTLAGTISGILWKNPTKADVTAVHLAVTVIAFLLTAVFMGKCIKNADEKLKKPLLLLSVIIAVLPYGFMTFVNLFELLDIYWLLAAVLCLFAFDTNSAVFAVPVFIFIGLWAHFSFVFAFMPLIFIICFYKCAREKSKSTTALTAVTVGCAVGFTLYFYLTSRTFSFDTFEDFQDYILDKAGDKIIYLENYFGKSFRPTDEMNRIYGISTLPDDTPFIIGAFIGYFKAALSDTTFSGIVTDFVLASPFYVFFGFIWKKAFSQSETKAEKFIFFLCMISPLVHFFSCFMSSDTSRWLSLGIISNLFLLLYFAKEHTSLVSSAFTSVITFLEERKAPVTAALVFYFSIIFTW